MNDASAVKRALAAHALTPNRALGQNFLFDEATILHILDAADVRGALVLEIGPGLGALTEPLLTRASRVVAVEKDARLAESLRVMLPNPRLVVVTGDFLDADIASLTGGKDWLALGNLPYYVTTPIAEKLLIARPRAMTLMVQSEAAARFFAQPGERIYGPVAVLSQSLYRPARVCEAARNCFYPEPGVDSTVVRLTRAQDADTPDAAGFLRFLKRAFAMRRKTLRNNLALEPGYDAAADSLALSANVRAEAVSPPTLAALYGMLCDFPLR